MSEILIVAIGHGWMGADRLARELGLPGGKWRELDRRAQVVGRHEPRVIDAGLHIDTGLYSLKRWHEIHEELRHRRADVITFPDPKAHVDNAHWAAIRQLLISNEPGPAAIAFELIRVLAKAASAAPLSSACARCGHDMSNHGQNGCGCPCTVSITELRRGLHRDKFDPKRN